MKDPVERHITSLQRTIERETSGLRPYAVQSKITIITKGLEVIGAIVSWIWILLFDEISLQTTSILSVGFLWVPFLLVSAS